MAIGHVLETLYLLFDVDASKAKKGTEEVEKSTEKATESIKKMGKESDNVGKSFLSLAHSFSGLIASYIGAHAAISGFTGAVQYTQELGIASQALGVNVEQLDTWGQAVKTTGGTAEGFQSSLRGLAEHLGTTGNIALKVLPQLADVFQRLNKAQSFNYGKSLGLDESTILLLQKGRRELEATLKRKREFGVVTREDTEAASKFKNSIDDTSKVFRGLYNTIGSAILPILADMFEKYLIPGIEYLINHKDLITGTFIAIGFALGKMLYPLIKAHAALIALITGFSILFEDVERFNRGDQSFIGDLLKKGRRGKTEEELIAERTILRYKGEAYDKLTAHQLFLKTIGREPINNAPSNNSVLNQSAFNRNINVNTGPISVFTHANDAEGIAKSLGNSLTTQYEQAAYQFADGAMY